MLAVVLVFVLFGAMMAQDREDRLMSVHLDVKTHEIRATTATGVVENGTFNIEKLHEYVIDLDNAMMSKDNGPGIRFSMDEAAIMHRVVTEVMLWYAAVSVQWYEQEGGGPSKPKAKGQSAGRARPLRSFSGSRSATR